MAYTLAHAIVAAGSKPTIGQINSYIFSAIVNFRFKFPVLDFGKKMTLEAIQYQNGKLRILDQLKLPHESIYVDIKGVDDGFNAIRTMQVRGAPAIAIVGCLSLVVEMKEKNFSTIEEFKKFLDQKFKILLEARPTAVNLKNSRDFFISFVNSDETKNLPELKSKIFVKIQK